MFCAILRVTVKGAVLKLALMVGTPVCPDVVV